MVDQALQTYKPSTKLVEMFRSNKKKLMGMLLAGMDKDRFIRAAWIQLSTNETLAQCDEASIIQALIKCGQQGLYPDGVNGHAYLVPFKGKAVYIRGYKGTMALFGANPNAADLPVICEFVHENDGFNYGLGAKPFLEHTPEPFGDRGKRLGVYALFRFKSGDVYPKVMSIKEAMEGKALAKTPKFWNDFPDAMMKKYCIHRGAKLLPLADTVSGAIRRDENVQVELDDGNIIEGDVINAIAVEEAIEDAAIQQPKPLPEGTATNNCGRCGRQFEPDKLMDGVCGTCLDNTEEKGRS